MKKLIYIILICPLLALGQTLNEDKTGYTEVVEVNLTKEEIHKKIINWIAETYKSPKDIIQLNTEDKISIYSGFLFDFTFANANEDLRIEVVTYTIGNSIIFSLKDAKYRIELIPTEAFLSSRKISNIASRYMNGVLESMSKQEYIKQELKIFEAELMKVGIKNKQLQKSVEGQRPKVTSDYELYFQNKQKWETTVNDFLSGIKAFIGDTKEDDW